MTKERSQEIEFIRSEIIGPSRELFECSDKVSFDAQGRFVYPAELPGQGIPVFWRNDEAIPWQEVIHYKNETPLNSYGAGLLFPGGLRQGEIVNGNNAHNAVNNSQDSPEPGQEVTGITVQDEEDIQAENVMYSATEGAAPIDVMDYDFDITSPDIYRPSTLGITFCIVGDGGELVISLPASKLFLWQKEDDAPFQVNGRYEKCEKTVKSDGTQNNYPAWRRFPATTNLSSERIKVSQLQHGKKQRLNVPLPEGSSLSLAIEIFPRKISGQWIVTVVLRNSKSGDGLNTNESKIIHTLFQSYFEVRLEGSCFARYPEGVRPFEQFDADEQSLALIYQDAATWAIGHGCAAGWDAALGETPACLYADVMPAVELPSMTPDVKDDKDNPISLSMRELAELPAYDVNHAAWKALEMLLDQYDNWIKSQKDKIINIDVRFKNVASRHMDACRKCHDRIKIGIDILRHDEKARTAFKLANKSMLLQQIASKQLDRRPLRWNGDWVAPIEPGNNDFRSPVNIYEQNAELDVGSWRAFQIAFLLMSIDGLVKETDSDDRDIVDLIWFPTGGGKTEAYLGVAAFYMFHQRLLMPPKNTQGELGRDGTNVFMRYTLRMLTTQQFQRAASLICAMEYIRDTNPNLNLGKTRFSLGLWIGGDGSPNNCEEARTRIRKFRRDGDKGNPLVLTECPWCRSEIGRLKDDPRKNKKGKKEWSDICTAGYGTDKNEPVIKCSDIKCHFGGEDDTLPVEVIDERIYRIHPSMFIGTADKFAMLAYRPEAGSLFGRKHTTIGDVVLERMPPGLIIQDEFHLISGPLGTMYGVYEGVIEKLCSFDSVPGQTIKPKIIASTATIRGAQEQVKAIYARQNVQLFPSPALLMKDSFFGRYAISDDTGTLCSGRLYLGIHAHGYGSFLTTQVRAFTAALFRSWFFADEKKDAWWTLLAFYNSLRELGGARTLFSSDIASRIKNYSFRYGCKNNNQRYLNAVEELTSRKSQAELVQMMDRLAVEWDKSPALDACLASNIIEVGVDIDRLSLMAVVGQPKSTAQYIQVTGRVGRKWWERPGLILAMYNPSKSRDRSHFEQFHSYHRRLYEQVEPTSATPFSVEAIDRAMTGALLLWARQFYDAPRPGEYLENYQNHLEVGRNVLLDRCQLIVQESQEQQRVIAAIERVYNRLIEKWERNPQMWEQYPQNNNGEYLMLWPGQFATEAQRKKGETIPSSMRNVDSNAYLQITQHYILNGDQ